MLLHLIDRDDHQDAGASVYWMLFLFFLHDGVHPRALADGAYKKYIFEHTKKSKWYIEHKKSVKDQNEKKLRLSKVGLKNFLLLFM